MVLIFSTPLNLGLESSCAGKRLNLQSLSFPIPSQQQVTWELKDQALGLGMVAGRKRMVMGTTGGIREGEGRTGQESQVPGLQDISHLIKICNDLVEKPQALEPLMVDIGF